MRTQLNEASKSKLLALCEGNSPVISEFPAQSASNAEKSFHLMTSSCKMSGRRCCVTMWCLCSVISEVSEPIGPLIYSSALTTAQLWENWFVWLEAVIRFIHLIYRLTQTKTWLWMWYLCCEGQPFQLFIETPLELTVFTLVAHIYTSDFNHHGSR